MCIMKMQIVHTIYFQDFNKTDKPKHRRKTTRTQHINYVKKSFVASNECIIVLIIITIVLILLFQPYQTLGFSEFSEIVDGVSALFVFSYCHNYAERLFKTFGLSKRISLRTNFLPC